MAFCWVFFFWGVLVFGGFSLREGGGHLAGVHVKFKKKYLQLFGEQYTFNIVKLPSASNLYET